MGRRGLAEYLRRSCGVEESLARQEAVRELLGRVDLRERMALLGRFDFFESKWETFTEWLDLPPARFPRVLQISAFLSSASVLAVILCGLTGLLPFLQAARWIAPVALLHAAIGFWFRRRVNRMIAWLGPISTETQVLRGSARSLPRLEWLLRALEDRNKEWFYGPSLLLLAGTQLCMAIEQWRIEHRESLRTWLDAWGEFEALNALANYAYENPEDTFPEFVGDEARFEAEALGHPLLADASCVRNDVRLNPDFRFYVISGSNMSGKSTLLRAIGLNAVLAFAGAPVRARALRLSRLSVWPLSRWRTRC